MKQYLLMTTIVLVSAIKLPAQYYSVNIDTRTVAAMTEAFGMEAATEAYYLEQINEMFKSYTSAEVAAATIFSSKYLERKAKADLGIWSSSTENYYYRRIYNLVAHKILPKILTVGRLMLRNPQGALYWGSYLMKICADTKALCMQFESVVTNGKLGFSGINFLELCPEAANLMNLGQKALVDWDKMLGMLANFPQKFDKSSLEESVTTLYSIARSMAADAKDDMLDKALSQNSLNGIFQGKVSGITDAVKSCEQIYGKFSDLASKKLLSITGKDATKLFTASDYDMNEWFEQNDGVHMNQYYTQRWYIIAYRATEPAYEETIDTFTTDPKTFEELMNIKLKEMQEAEPELHYFLQHDERRYYTRGDTGKLHGASSAIISVTCHEGAELYKGMTQYKCRQCNGNMDEHLRKCVLETTVTDEAEDTPELDKAISDLKAEIKSIQSMIDQLEKSNRDILDQIALATKEEASDLRAKMLANKKKIDELTANQKQLQTELDEAIKAKEEAESDKDVPNDAHYRIPAIMRDLGTAFGIKWSMKDAGWKGDTYCIYGEINSTGAKVTLSVDVSISRKPKRVLGILVHRTIVKLDYKLTTENSDTQVAEIVYFQTMTSEGEKKRQMDEAIDRVLEDYPECEISSEYIGNDPVEDDSSQDTYHLLWSSDRLEIARGVDSRLHKIYTDLICLQKMLGYKRDIIDILLGIMPELNAEQGRRLTLVREAHKRWMHSAKYYKNENEGKEEKDEDGDNE